MSRFSMCACFIHLYVQILVGSLQNIDSDIAVQNSKCFLTFSRLSRPNSFVIITAHRVLQCMAESAEEMHHWITLLQRTKGDTRVQGQEFIVRGKKSKVLLRFH